MAGEEVVELLVAVAVEEAEAVEAVPHDDDSDVDDDHKLALDMKHQDKMDNDLQSDHDDDRDNVVADDVPDNREHDRDRDHGRDHDRDRHLDHGQLV